MIALTFLLGGCESKLNEEYYKRFVEANNIELDVVVVTFINQPLQDNERIVFIEYIEYYEHFQFTPIKLYSFCVLDKCKLISFEQYLEYRRL